MNTVTPMAGAPSPAVLLPPGSAVPPADLPDPLARAYPLPCTLVLEVPIVGFSVGSLMSLTVGSVLETASQQNEDLTLRVNGQTLGRVEFEVIGDRLAVRLTGMA